MACCDAALCTGGATPDFCFATEDEEKPVERTESLTEMRDLHAQPEGTAASGAASAGGPAAPDGGSSSILNLDRALPYRKFVRPGRKGTVTKDMRPREGLSLRGEPDMCGMSCLGWTCGMSSYIGYANFDEALEKFEDLDDGGASALPEPTHSTTSLISTCTHPCAPYEDPYDEDSEEEVIAFVRDMPAPDYGNSGLDPTLVHDLRSKAAFGS